jgi:lipopolysaccharide/colanic/teichoic acid biosynthesis glycosyltransferase
MYYFTKRTLDIFIASFAIITLFPLIALISVVLMTTSGFPIFYLQERVGKDWKSFRIVKFRTMINNADKIGSISAHNDMRITKFGGFLRKFKLDELPQLFNVFMGDMSLVGPRPELLKYAECYSNEYSEILKIKPGITDYASIKFCNESIFLNDPFNNEKIYLNTILPQKISLYKKYLKEVNLNTDLKILFTTVKAIFK